MADQDTPTLKRQVILKLDVFIKLIPHFSREEDIYQLINACDLAVHALEKINVLILIRYITPDYWVRR